MSVKRFAPEEIISKLREAEVYLAQGSTVVEMCKKIGVTEQTYYRWRTEYGGLRLDQAKRLKSLETENGRLKKLVADQALDIAILKEASSGNFWARPSAGRRWSMCGRCWAGRGCRSGGPAGCWASPDPCSGGTGRCPATSPGWWRAWWRWRPSTAAMATGG